MGRPADYQQEITIPKGRYGMTRSGSVLHGYPKGDTRTWCSGHDIVYARKPPRGELEERLTCCRCVAVQARVAEVAAGRGGAQGQGWLSAWRHRRG